MLFLCIIGLSMAFLACIQFLDNWGLLIALWTVCVKGFL